MDAFSFCSMYTVKYKYAIFCIYSLFWERIVMKLGIISNIDKDHEYAFARTAAGMIQARGACAIVDQTYADSVLGKDPNVSISGYEACDLIFCIGGDGTFLSAVHDHYLKKMVYQEDNRCC